MAGYGASRLLHASTARHHVRLHGDEPDPSLSYGETMYADAEVWSFSGGTDEDDGGATQRMWLKIAMGKLAAPGYRLEPLPRPD